MLLAHGVGLPLYEVLQQLVDVELGRCVLLGVSGLWRLLDQRNEEK